MPDISILIELSEFYDVDIKEIIDGERKSEYMNEETKEMMDKVVDYTTADKEMLITKTQKYSATAGIILAVFDFSNKYYQITEVLFGVALIYIIAVFCCEKMSINLDIFFCKSFKKTIEINF